jgi:hypothetical protein
MRYCARRLILFWLAVCFSIAGCPEVTLYHPPTPPEDLLVDDRLEDKQTRFDPEMVHPDPIDGWAINLSEAVIRLDLPLVRPDREVHLLRLHASYKAASDAAEGEAVLPSVNMIDGKAKQFDDGLLAALAQAYYQGLGDTLTSHVDLVRRIFDAVGLDGAAAPLLAAGLELAGEKVEPVDEARKRELLGRFLSNELLSKPIGFYSWNETLQTSFRFLRFFRQPIDESDLAVLTSLVEALRSRPLLRAEYRQMVEFYGQLTNPALFLSLDDLVDLESLDRQQLASLRSKKGVTHSSVAVLPPSTSREGLLFEKLFGEGLPPNADLMRELITRVRSGELDLEPDPKSGWYDHQVYALETLLLPERGEENQKLLLTSSYKRRMLEAFAALITKRRESHVGDAVESAALVGPPETLEPRLRVEPCPSYFVRTARAYAFLLNFLEATMGGQALGSLTGLSKAGSRDMDLYAELQLMRELFYGLYLVSSEDIGHRPRFLDGEQVATDRCYSTAIEWLAGAFDDPDLAADTRVSIPVFADPQRRVTRLWMTLGVRLTPLEVSFARPPHIKAVGGPGDWQAAAASTLASRRYLIPVDEFAEVELPGSVALTREEFRTLCDEHETKQAILEALQARP